MVTILLSFTPFFWKWWWSGAIKNTLVWNLLIAIHWIITLNVKGVFAQDEASYLNSKGVCVRSGEHCAKLLKERLKVFGTIRVSTYFYNDKNDIDILVNALKQGGDFLDAYFN